MSDPRTYDEKRAEAPLCPCGRFYVVGGGACFACRRERGETIRATVRRETRRAQ